MKSNIISLISDDIERLFVTEHARGHQEDQQTSQPDETTALSTENSISLNS